MLFKYKITNIICLKAKTSPLLCKFGSLNLSSNTTDTQEDWPLYLAIILLIPILDLIVGANLQYGYFVLLRVLASIGFAYMAYQNFNYDNEIFGKKYFLVCGVIAVLYNPILPVHLTRETWTIVNLATAALAFHHWQLGKKGKFKNDFKDHAQAQRPSKPLERTFYINFDKDVIAPLRLQKSNFPKYFYSERGDRLISLWSLGYVHGFMAYATFQDVSLDHDEALAQIQPFTDDILNKIFSEKECTDFRILVQSRSQQSDAWVDGFEWGVRNCESWQEHGEVTKIWSDYISGKRDSIFKFDVNAETNSNPNQGKKTYIQKAKDNSQEQTSLNPPNPDIQTILFMGSPEQICEQYLSMEAKSRALYQTALRNHSIEEYGTATMRLAAYSSVAIYGFCFFLARNDIDKIEIRPQQTSKVIYSDFLLEFFDFVWAILNYTCHNYKFSGFDERELHELLGSTDIETNFFYIALHFLVGDENVDYAYRVLQNEISKKEIQGRNLNQTPLVDTKDICAQLMQLNLIGDPTELQVFNARFQQSTFDNPRQVDQVVYAIRQCQLFKNLHTRLINSVTESQTAYVHETFDGWLAEFKAECDKVKAGVSDFIDFMETDGLKRAYTEGKKPSDVAYNFAKNFDPSKLQ